MKKLAIFVIVAMFAASTASAQTISKEHFSPWLSIIGVMTVGVGIAMMTAGGDNYTVLGNDLCVSTNANGGRVDAGLCQAASSPHTALWVVGAGGAMIAIGLVNVTVRPSRTGISASATVKWGKK